MPQWFRADILLPLSGLLPAVGFVLALLLLAHVLRSKRPPSSTIAWLLTIVLLPYFGVPLYLMFGGRKTRRMAGAKHPVYDQKRAALGGTFGAGTERILRSCGLPPATTGNKVRFICTGEDAYQVLMRLIDEAEETIHITTYILGRDTVGAAVVARLARKAAEGVKVRLLLDSVGSWRVSRRYLRPLTDAGGEVAFFMPVLHIPFRGRSNLRNHRKIVAADRKVALTGGMNIAEDYLGPRPDPKRWRDVSLVVEGPAAAHLDDLFCSDWSFATGQPFAALGASEEPSPSIGETPVQVVASGPDVEGDPLYDSLIALLFAAQRRIWIVTPYFVPDEILARALELAARRGLDVRLVIPFRSNHVTADLARAGYLRPIQEAGGKVLRYLPAMIHAKVTIIDDELAVVGSANMDIRSLFLNYEVALFLYAPAQVEEAASWVRSLFPDCRPGLAHRSWALSMAESVVRLLSPLL
jgi:cardiolipin synthase